MNNTTKFISLIKSLNTNNNNSHLLEAIVNGYHTCFESTAVEPHKIRITYEIVTPDDAETGEASERGWIDEEGVNMELDEFDIEDGKNIVDETVKYLQREGAIHPSDYPGAARWYSTEGSQDSNWITKSYHFVNYTPEELEAIASKMI